MFKQTQIAYIATAFIAVFAVVVAIYLFDSYKKSPTSELLIPVGSGKQYFSAQYPIIDDCSKEIPLHLLGDDSTSFDLENGIVQISWFDTEKQENTKHTFLYRPGANSEKCSESVKIKLEQAYQAEQERLKEYRKSCEEFKVIVRGEKPLPEKGGEKAKMQGVIDFVKQYCQ